MQRLFECAVKQRVPGLIVKISDQYRYGLYLLDDSRTAGDIHVDRQDQRGSEHADDNKVHLSAADRRDYRISGVRLRLNAVLCQVVDPGEHQHDRETNDSDEDDGAHGPLGRIECRKKNARRLNQNPGDPDVKSGCAKNFAAAQFPDEPVHSYRFVPRPAV